MNYNFNYMHLILMMVINLLLVFRSSLFPVLSRSLVKIYRDNKSHKNLNWQVNCWITEYLVAMMISNKKKISEFIFKSDSEKSTV